MFELECIKIIMLVKFIFYEVIKIIYEVIEFSELILIQVQQFYDE